MSELTHTTYEIAHESRIRPNLSHQRRKLPDKIPVPQPHPASIWSGRIFVFIDKRGCGRRLLFQCLSAANHS